MNHKELVDLAGKWLSRHNNNITIPNCRLVARELVAATSSGETPDVIGWCSRCSVLIEVKTSLKDFRRDLKKPFRIVDSVGMGDFRYYLCEEGLIKPSDIQEGWGLLYVNEKPDITIVKESDWFSESNIRAERTMLLSIIRRMETSN